MGNDQLNDPGTFIMPGTAENESLLHQQVDQAYEEIFKASLNSKAAFEKPELQPRVNIYDEIIDIHVDLEMGRKFANEHVLRDKNVKAQLAKVTKDMFGLAS